MSLIEHKDKYNIYYNNSLTNAVLFTGISYANRHFEMVKTCNKSTAVTHIALGIVELLPIIGAIVAIFERVIVSYMQVNRTEEKRFPRPLNYQIIINFNENLDSTLTHSSLIRNQSHIVKEDNNSVSQQRESKASLETKNPLNEAQESFIQDQSHIDNGDNILVSQLSEYEASLETEDPLNEAQISFIQGIVPDDQVVDSEDDQFILIPQLDVEEIERSFIKVGDETIEDLDSLLTYQDLGTGQTTIGLNPILSEENWADLLYANDLSYDLAKMHTVREDKLDRIHQHAEFIQQELFQRGWDHYSILFGQTGKSNIDDDASCVVLVNKEKNLVYVAFHGSRNGSKFNIFEKRGDWAANWDSTLVSAKDAGLKGAIEGVMFHRGFGLNFMSVQESLLIKLEKIVNILPKKPNIIVTGHSKGGGMASIAVPAITEYFKDRANVSAVTFSAPMAFNKAGADWVHTVVKIRNILRIKVLGDPVTYGSYLGKDYAHVGIRLKDKIKDVNRRTAEWHGEKIGWIEGMINYHYGAKRNGSWCFVPEIVMRQSELKMAFQEWVDSLHKENRSIYDVKGFVPL